MTTARKMKLKGEQKKSNDDFTIKCLSHWLIKTRKSEKVQICKIINDVR